MQAEDLPPQPPQQFPLALPGVNLLNTVVNGYFQYQNLELRKQEFAALNIQREQHHQDTLNQRDRHHEETQKHQQRQAEQLHNWRIEEPNWPLTLSPDQYAHKTTAHGRQPLMVLLSPPPQEADKDFRDAVRAIETQLHRLLQNSYNANDTKRPVQFIDKAWKKGMEGGAATAKALHHALHMADAPTLILDLDMTGRELHVKTHYWGIWSGELRDLITETAIPLGEYVAEVARRHAREWGEDSKDLGRDASPSKIDKENWKILQTEEELGQKNPSKAKKYTQHYLCPPEYLLEAIPEITPALQLLVGSMADLYHLFRYGTAPQVPTLLGKLLQGSNSAEVRALMRQTVADYAQVMDFAAEQHPALGPLFHLELAEGITGLEVPDLCQTHLLKSLAAWRKPRRADKAEHEAKALLEGMQYALKREDEAYLLRVANLLAKPLNLLDVASTALHLAGEAAKRPQVEAPKKPVLPPVENIHGWSADKVQALQKVTAEALSKPVVFRDTLASGGEGPDMVVIPAGAFLMGSPDSEPQRSNDEGSQHFVTFSQPFAIGRYAVTFDEYDRFCLATQRPPVADSGWGRGRRPVIHVTWQDAQDYCVWLSAQTGHSYRLPSEAEWEYACRAGTTTPFHWGSTITPKQANYDGNSAYNNGAKGEYRKQTVPVDQFQTNAFGLYQMHGNVWEWCTDAWHDSYTGAPQDCSAWDLTGAARVVRGGSWYSYAWFCRSASRYHNDPDYRNTGFRCARVLS